MALENCRQKHFTEGKKSNTRMTVSQIFNFQRTSNHLTSRGQHIISGAYLGGWSSCLSLGFSLQSFSYNFFFLTLTSRAFCLQLFVKSFFPFILCLTAFMFTCLIVSNFLKKKICTCELFFFFLVSLQIYFVFFNPS